MQQKTISLSTERNTAERIYDLSEAALGEDVLAISFFEDDRSSTSWTVSIYIDEDDEAYILEQLKNCLGSDMFGLTPTVNLVEQRDWVTESLQGLAPVQAGRFLIHGDHDKHVVQANHIGVEINAGQAFGTGHHGTTAGVLEMLEKYLKSHTPDIALDIGTGSGVLAIALAKAAKCSILASDIDPISTKTAAENAKINQVDRFIQCVTCAGFEHNAFRNVGRVPLIMANILARPLASLALDMERQLEIGGSIILSGLLPHQRAFILGAYRQQHLYHKASFYKNGWMTIWLQS